MSAFALVTLLSAFWGDSAERAVNEFNRAALYVGVFVLVSLFSSRLSRARWCDGFAIGICGVVIVSLISRFAPDTFSDRGAAEVLPGAVVRLSFPLGYWNGLAILAALAVPLLLRSGLRAGSHDRTCRGRCSPLPAIAIAIYLASSRGGYATALIGAVAFLRAEPRALVAAGSARGRRARLRRLGRRGRSAVGVRELPTSSAGRDEAGAALVSLALGCLAAGLTYGVLIADVARTSYASRRIGIAAVSAYGSRGRSWRRRHRSSGALPRVQARSERSRHSDRRLRAVASPVGERQRPLAVLGVGSDAFRAEPLLGHGAGSYEAWWAERGSLAVFVRDAHSLYLESLAEIGALGVLLLVAAFSVGIVTAVRQLRRMSVAEARDLAAPTAVFVAFTAAAAIDWMWEMTVVSVVAFSVPRP